MAYSDCIALLPSVITVHWIQIDQLINFRFSCLLHTIHTAHSVHSPVTILHR